MQLEQMSKTESAPGNHLNKVKKREQITLAHRFSNKGNYISNAYNNQRINYQELCIVKLDKSESTKHSIQ